MDINAVVARTLAVARPKVEEYGDAICNCTAVLRRAGASVFDRGTGDFVTTDGGIIYDGPVRVHNVAGGSTYNLAGEEQYFGDSYVFFPLSAPLPHVDDDIEITSDPDGVLIDRHYRITGVDSGGLLPAGHRCAVVGAEPAPNVEL